MSLRAQVMFDALWESVEDLIPKDKLQQVARQWVELVEQDKIDMDISDMCQTKLAVVAGIKKDEDGYYAGWDWEF